MIQKTLSYETPEAAVILLTGEGMLCQSGNLPSHLGETDLFED